MSKKILVANWKNRPGSQEEALSLLRNLSRAHLKYKKLSFFIAPPLPYLGLVRDKAGKFAKLASQDIPKDGRDALTGGFVPEMLQSFGVRAAIVGHSERRALGETDADVAEKVRTALKHGIMPLVCVGEEIHDAEGEYLHFLRDQLKHSLEGVKKSEAGSLMLAYEPVWAVGAKSKGAMSPKDVNQAVIYIRRLLTDMYGRESAERIPILYGGSVDASNVEELVQGGNVDGLLLGRASLDHSAILKVAEALI